MSKRRLTIVLAIPVVLAVVLTGALYMALHTSSGARWILAGLENQLPGNLEIGEVEGDFDSGLLLQKLGYTDAALSVRLARIRLAVGLEFFPMAVRVRSLNIHSLELIQLSDEPGQASLEDTLASLALPLTVNVDGLRIDGLVFSGMDGAEVFKAETLSFAGRLNHSLKVDELVLEIPEGKFQLDGRLELETPFTIAMNMESRLALPLTGDSTAAELDIHIGLRGDLAHQLEMILALEQPRIDVTASARRLLDSPTWQLDLESPGLWWPLDTPQAAEFRAESLRLHSTGDIGSYTLEANGRLQMQETDLHQFKLQALGNPSGLIIQDLELRGPTLDLAGSSELNWQDGYRVSLAASLNYLNPAVWIAEWPEQHPVKGEMEISLQDQSLQISQLHLEVDGSAASLDGSGNVDLKQGSLASDLAWKDASWPISAEAPKIRSPLGRVLLSGTLDDWKLTGNAGIESAALPPGALRFEANGDREHAEIKLPEGQILGGTLSGVAEIDWSDGGSWSAAVAAEGIETQGLNAALPGAFNADLTASGALEPLRLDLDIRKLEGVIRGNQLTARGRMSYQTADLEFIDVLLSSETSRVKLNGNAFSDSGVDFSANIPDLGSFLLHGSGAIKANGRLSLQPENPRLRLDLVGRDVVWDEIQLPQISIHDSMDSGTDAIADLRLEARQPKFGEQQLNDVTLDLYLGETGQTAGLVITKSGLKLSAELRGALLDQGLPVAQSEWAGQLQSLLLSEGDEVTLSLLEPAGIEVSSRQASITGACLGIRSDSKLCLDAGWMQNGPIMTNLKLTQFPLDLIESLADTELEFTQYADGELNWTSQAVGPPSGHAAIRLSPGEVRYVGEQDALFSTGEGLIGFELDQGRLSSGNFDVPLPGLGVIDLDINMSNIDSGLDSGMDGRLKVELSDLNLLTVFLPAIDQAEGRFNAILALGGSARNPSFNGELSLTNGLVRNDASGLRLSDIQLSGQVKSKQETRMTGSFRAREGSGRLEASLDFSDIFSPRVELDLSGEGLKLFNAPDLEVIAEPDVQLTWQDGIIDISGSLLIPSARIAPSVIPESTVSQSPDLVIVAGELPKTEAATETQSDLKIRGDFEVTLGDEVELDLSVAVVDVDGSVKFNWQDELVPVANGSYHLAGQIQAFGQLLQITEGNIGFPGVPADNPHLNIRAERQIYGNSEIRRAGVFVTGTLQRPILEPYTDPMTNRERAQTLLITGSDFNMETGVGAVNIGTYIAPRIFVSYGIGVFEDENVISIRYDLGRNWGIKATSGERQTGLDISYTIEN